MKIIRKNQENIFPLDQLKPGSIFEFNHAGMQHVALKISNGSVFCFDCNFYNSIGNTVHDLIKEKELVKVLDCELHIK